MYRAEERDDQRAVFPRALSWKSNNAWGFDH